MADDGTDRTPDPKDEKTATPAAPDKKAEKKEPAVTIQYRGNDRSIPPERFGMMPPPFGRWERGEKRVLTESWYKEQFPHQALSLYEFAIWLWGPLGAENVTPGRFIIVSGLPDSMKDQMGVRDVVPALHLRPGAPTIINHMTSAQPPEQIAAPPPKSKGEGGGK